MIAPVAAPAWSKFLDVYDWRARAVPAILCLLPALVVVLIVYPDSATWARSGLTLLMSCGFFFALTRISRDAGKRIQDRLFKEWSGAPTTQLLRHRDNHYDMHTKQALHERLGKLAGLNMPTARQEQKDPVAADEVYRAVCHWLIKRTRDTQRFPLLFKENIHFGFQRNALGLRWIGISVALASVLLILLERGVLSLQVPYYAADRWGMLTNPTTASLMFSLLMAVFWFLGITSAAAKRTGFAYAERLLECADLLTPESQAS